MKLTNNNTQETVENAQHFGLQIAEEWQIWISHSQATCIHETTIAHAFSSISKRRLHYSDAPVGI